MKKSGSKSNDVFSLQTFVVRFMLLVVFIWVSVLGWHFWSNLHPKLSNVTTVETGNVEPQELLVTSKNSNDFTLGVRKPKIAYAITVTKDGPFLDGALVLGYGAIKSHITSKSKYEPELVAFVTPEIVVAKDILSKLGWKVLVKDLPVSLDEIENSAYVEKMKNSGCCGASEFLKLWAYTLVEYERVVHLDMDSVVFQNMDELFTIDKGFLYTGDWNMKGRSPVPPAQGGFLVVKPDMETFKQFQSVIRKGDWGANGWGGSNIGNFWGGQTIQGIMPYFYNYIQPGNSLEVNRCIYNVMVDNPFYPDKKKTPAPGGTLPPPRCLNNNATCEDCRNQVPELVKSAHFTICQKPWTCTAHDNPKNARLCSALHEMWFKLREEFEISQGWWKLTANGQPVSPYSGSLYRGMCKGYGENNYQKMPVHFT